MRLDQCTEKTPEWNELVAMAPKICSFRRDTGWIREEDAAKSRANKIPGMSDDGPSELSVGYCRLPENIS